MTTISHACHITNTNGHELDKTIDIYRRATSYIINIVILRLGQNALPKKRQLPTVKTAGLKKPTALTKRLISLGA